jgi:hypothetical protein
MRPTKIISGGQTGADLGALVAAQKLGIATGGTAPLGYRTERGPQPEILRDRFGLTEAETSNYDHRTLINIRAADATLIVADRPASAGTGLTIRLCRLASKPYILNPTPDELNHWLHLHKPAILNVAGNRESVAPGIAQKTIALLTAVLSLAQPLAQSRCRHCLMPLEADGHCMSTLCKGLP